MHTRSFPKVLILHTCPWNHSYKLQESSALAVLSQKPHKNKVIIPVRPPVSSQYIKSPFLESILKMSSSPIRIVTPESPQRKCTFITPPRSCDYEHKNKKQKIKTVDNLPDFFTLEKDGGGRKVNSKLSIRRKQYY